jgi:hypothetical protein
MCGRILLLSSLLFTLVVGLLPINPTITPPAVLPRQIDDRFIGYQLIGNTCEHNSDINAKLITDLTSRDPDYMRRRYLVSSTQPRSVLRFKPLKLQLRDSMYKWGGYVHRPGDVNYGSQGLVGADDHCLQREKVNRSQYRQL